MIGRPLLDALTAAGLSTEDAETAGAVVLAAVGAALRAGKPVRIPDVGTLRPKKRRRRIRAPGPDRGKGIEETLVSLQHAAVLASGEPYAL